MEAPRLEIGSICTSCDNCRLICPENAILIGSKGYTVESWSCTLCHLCVEICPVDCIKLVQDEANKAVI